jgi:hypothetical protein
MLSLPLAAAVAAFLAAQSARAEDCVTIGTPKPSAGYTYQRRDANGTTSEYTNYWQEVTAKGSQVRTVRREAVTIQINEHHIEDDVSVIDRTTSRDALGRVEATTFSPGVVGDPAFRACAGRSWPIRSGTARHTSARTNASAQTYPGTLTIIGIREAVTVPAGRFETVHYIRTQTTPAGKSVDEYWKSTEHGVIVKHTSKLPGGASSEVLQSIR